jgi:DNA-binding CsgD family transcriptional regulator
MTDGYHALTEKEKQTLRLLLAGHDAKSLARHFGLSIHTINERLRDARRKLSASSSREAARLLLDAEGAHPQSLGDNGIADAAGAAAGQEGGTAHAGRRRRAAWAIGGFAMISLALVAFALSGAPQAPQHRAQRPAPQTRPVPVAESPVTEAARQWLALVDAGKWPESFAATAKSFQTLNTLDMWQSASVGGRVPLGRVLSRRLAAEESVPGPPNGYQVVRFKTDFSSKPGATETLSLAREDGIWRIVGYIIE